MPLNPGTRLGPFEIASQLGEGGMGQVYRARDTRLGRDVALKVLPDSFADDPDRLMRFEREARTLASLNHPHIANIHGLEESEGTRALVMELVAGEDLSKRIGRGPIPLDEALPMARQIAAALEGAHELGIVHRDLKPANIMVRADGTVKVLDFGLAKELDRPDANRPTLDASPTFTSPAMTAAGIILGTAPYMSPEQAKAKPVDKRTDIWAFGCVLYEMLTGKRAFPGDDVAETLASVIKSEPDWTALPPSTPASVRRLLTRALQKDQRQRLADIHDARLELDDREPVVTETAVVAAADRRREYTAWAAVAALAVVIAVLGASRWRTVEAPHALTLRFQIPGPAEVTLLQSAVLSPDGTHVVFFTNTNNVATFWMRALDSLDLRRLEGTPDSVSPVAPPFFSPDSRYLAFWDGQDRKLKRLPVEGGVPQVICDAPNYAGGAWGNDGTIVFGTRGAGLFRVPASGGTPQPITKLDSPREAGHINPLLLPDGRHVIYHAQLSGDARPLVLTTLDAKESVVIVNDAVSGDAGGACYVPPAVEGGPGHLVYRVRQRSTLMARPLDPVTFTVSGDEQVITDDVSFFSASAAGLLAYHAGTLVQGASNRLLWMDGTGKEGPQVGPSGNYQDLRLSPDGRRAVYSQRDASAGPYDIWLLDLVRGVPSRFTFEPSDDRFPAWSADGSWVAYGSGVGRAHSSLQRRDVSGSGRPEVISDGSDVALGDMSTKGEFLIYRDKDATGGDNLMVLKMSDPPGQRRATPYLDAPYGESSPVFMPGGAAEPSWVAYVSNESGRPEVYVQSFPVGRGKFQVSNGGGMLPRWAPDGKQLYFLADGRVMVVPVTTGPSLELGAARQLAAVNASAGYDVAPDGRLLVIASLADAGPAPAPQITVIANWQRALTTR